MKALKIASIGIVLLLIYACSHPIEIIGQGDVTSNYGRVCTLEDSLTDPVPDNCAVNLVNGDVDYTDVYTAMPRSEWQFDRWENCEFDGLSVALGNTCRFTVSTATVRKAWGETMPPLRAIFILNVDPPFCELNTCSDAVACTVDSCDNLQGCLFTPNDAFCGDGNLCNGVETCDGNFGCVAGTALNCDDENACTDDSCSSVSGCQHVNNTASISCYQGPAGTLNVGVCRAGVGTCSGGSPDNSCAGQVLPEAEICGDGLDNDCDGQVDEGCP